MEYRAGLVMGIIGGGRVRSGSAMAIASAAREHRLAMAIWG
jgi:hypothetical protein